jgi:hypothetical protein
MPLISPSGASSSTLLLARLLRWISRTFDCSCLRTRLRKGLLMTVGGGGCVSRPWSKNSRPRSWWWVVFMMGLLSGEMAISSVKRILVLYQSIHSYLLCIGKDCQDGSTRKDGWMSQRYLIIDYSEL